jgi:hypothetical protein
MDLCVHLPLIVTLIITLELDQVPRVIVMHSAIQYRLDLVLLLTIDESCGWGWLSGDTGGSADASEYLRERLE